jgi:hypothetical protein
MPRVKKNPLPIASDLRPAPVKEKKVMGRPKELGTKVQELKERLLMSEDSSRIVAKVIAKALNDEDKDQMVALKLCLDRILPVSSFEKAKNEGAKIQVNITTAEAPVFTVSETGEVEEDDESDS